VANAGGYDADEDLVVQRLIDLEFLEFEGGAGFTNHSRSYRFQLKSP
tara:strand:- start:1129 stop:1269 length:141 start_codon:yes stop_codon:yes gene_type:complete